MITDPEHYNANRDKWSYPPIPHHLKEFWTGFRWEVPTKVIYWDWSVTFGRWGALVEFADGTEQYTWPKDWEPLP